MPRCWPGKPVIPVTIRKDKSARLGHVVMYEDMRNFFCCPLGLQAADAYFKPRWRRRGAHEEARAGRFGDPNDGG